MSDSGTVIPLPDPMAVPVLDSTDRRARAHVMREVYRVHRHPRPDTPFCECGHADDEHHGKQGELHCSAGGCGCGRFLGVRA